ncbi:MAG: radical SAM protein [Pseudomonadota bacterium]
MFETCPIEKCNKPSARDSLGIGVNEKGHEHRGIIMLKGFVEYIDEFTVKGWVIDTEFPNKCTTVHCYVDNEKMGEAVADNFRSDIKTAGLSDGWSGYVFYFPGKLESGLFKSVKVFAVNASGVHFPLPRLRTTGRVQSTRDSQLNVYNFLTLRSELPDRFAYIRFDPNNCCNVRCVYCHNHRSSAIITTEDFRAFVDHNVLSVENFQMGCIMEPTLDQRLGDLLLLVANSRARPRYNFVLQTNGILLDRHDPGKIRQAGLTHLSLSIDSVDPEINKALRGGANIEKLKQNITNFAKNCPEVEVVFITTVTQLNILAMEPLVRFGMDFGVGHFTFREVFYHPDNDMVDHSRMPALMLLPGDFTRMAQGLVATFGDSVTFLFSSDESRKQGVAKHLGGDK